MAIISSGLDSSFVIPFLNLKGGVAKTTNAVAVAERLACDGFSVLVIDADHQCTAGELLLGERRLLDAEKRRTTLHDLLRHMLNADEFDPARFNRYAVQGGSNIKEAQGNLSVIPCSYRMDDFQILTLQTRFTADLHQAASIGGHDDSCTRLQDVVHLATTETSGHFRFSQVVGAGGAAT